MEEKANDVICILERRGGVEEVGRGWQWQQQGIKRENKYNVHCVRFHPSPPSLFLSLSVYCSLSLFLSLRDHKVLTSYGQSSAEVKVTAG